MKKSQAAKYARWSAFAALLCAALTASVYVKRGYKRYIEQKNAPPAPEANVERQSTKLTFSKGEGTRTIFTVEASKSTDFKGLNASDLEGVKVTIFGKDGTRHDTLETHACRYSKDSGNFDCSGDVEITLMTRDEWEAVSGKTSSAAMKVVTRGIVFNRASGEAKTDQQVRFTFANGSGQAIGATYNSDAGTLQLLRDVRLKLDQPVAPKGTPETKPSASGTAPASPKEPVDVRGSRMDFQRDAGVMYLSGPAEAKTQTERLTAAGFLLMLDSNFHAKRLIAKGNGKEQLPEFTSQHGVGRQRLSADEIAADFAPQGWVTRAEANDQVNGEAEKGAETQTVSAQSAAMEMLAGRNVPKFLVLNGRVDARTKTTAPGGQQQELSARRLTTEELRIAFAENASRTGTRLENAETAAPGRLEWNDAENAETKAARTILQANQLSMRFDAAGAASRLDAKGQVQTERAFAGGKQTATANRGVIDMQPRAGWSRMELDENVQLNEAQRSARADQAVFVRADQTATLTGHATARDATSQTSAQQLTFWQSSGDLRAEGNVRSSDLSARDSAVRLAPVASNISADNLTGNSKTGRALYTGHARLWQGDSVLEAESIELLKNERIMNANGHVRAVFPQAAANESGQPAIPGGKMPASKARSGPPDGDRSKDRAKAPVLWHAQSAKLTYWDAENRAHLSQNVLIQAPDQKMTGQELDLYFTRAVDGSSGTNTPGTPGAQLISRAVGSGGVTVQQGDRRATAERGVYTASDGKFVMTGGTPTLFDAAEGTTTGRQLTFFLADATIIVDSENGSRTLTKHRVEK